MNGRPEKESFGRSRFTQRRPHRAAARRDFSAATRQRTPQVRRSRVGRGVFARRYYAGGEVIGEILGTVIARSDYTSPYCYCMGDHRTLEPDAPFRFLNHSCRPNSRFEWYDLRAPQSGAIERRVFVLAMGAIRPGDEFTIDYRWPPEMAIPCRCGSTACRGWVIDLDDLADFLTTRPLSTE